MMSFSKICLILIALASAPLLLAAPKGRDSPRSYDLNTATCRVIDKMFTLTHPWAGYPIIYEPIRRGRLTVWTGLSSLPTSEFTCHGKLNATDTLVMEFDNYANKLEWTFYGKFKEPTNNLFKLR